MGMSDWSEAEEFYLIELCKLSQYLAQRYNICYLTYKRYQTRTRIPQIVISSISGLFSFGTSVFPPSYHSAVNISVGVSAMVVALVGSIESFLKIPEIIAGSISASVNFSKLAETISVELALPRHKRALSGILFLREAYKTYEKHSEAAPSVFKHVRFIRPFANTTMGRKATPSSIVEPNLDYSEGEGTPSSFRGKSFELYRSFTNNLTDGGGSTQLPEAPLVAPRPRSAIDLPV